MKKDILFKGSAVALATPFDENGIDYTALGRLIEFQIEGGTDAIVVCGTTGEASTLTETEKKEIIAFSVSAVGGRIPLIAGTGSNNTACACRMSEFAAKAGADGLLVVTPYYNKCTKKGLIEYYNEIAGASALPFIAYSVPSRTGVTIDPDTAFAISESRLAVGFKDAGDSISETAKTIAKCGESLPVYSGNDDRILPVLSLGGKGVISVAANILPKQIKRLCEMYFSGKATEASALQTGLMPLITALFSEVNPIPLKAAMEKMGLCRNILRAPLTEIGDENRTLLEKALCSYF